MLMQELWKAKVGCDDTLPPEFGKKWEAIEPSFRALPRHKLSRRYSRPCSAANQESEFHLHIFCDASAKVYAACAYLVSIQGGLSSVDLLFSKSRIAPVKGLTIPKLELTAVVSGTRIMQFIEKHMKLNFASKTIWTDSTCTLCWIASEKVSTTFVQNRVREIRFVPGLQFRYVPTVENPADLGSRGVSFASLVEKGIWWKGPSWLFHSEDKWPKQDHVQVAVSKPEPDDAGLVVVSSSPLPDAVFQLDRFSSLSMLLRVTSWVFRFQDSLRQKAVSNGLITAKEIQDSMKFWERRTQGQHFEPILKETKEPQWKMLVKQLGLFVDAFGLIRCQGRFAFSESQGSEAKYPLLLPKDSEFTRLVIDDCYKEVMHFGVKHTLSRLRERYWICHGRSVVKSVLRECRVCRRYGGDPFRVLDPPSLPSFRASIKRSFSCTGLDYLGPLFVKHQPDSKKVWIYLFTCAVTRAVHLEVVASLSATDFCFCLRRFVAMFGKPDVLVSDNARQFKAADQMLKKEFKRLSEEDDVREYLSNSGISWDYIVEKAPWMEGFYERLVAVAKEALKKSLGSWSVSHEELQTLAYEASHVMNSRPLIYNEDDPSDKVLTPLDLMFRSNSCFPDGSGEQVFAKNPTKSSDALESGLTTFARILGCMER